MKLAIVGSRSIHDYEWFRLLPELQNLSADEIISGGAPGVDRMAKRYAKEHDMPIRVILADWDKHGRSAGMIRNVEIVKQAHIVLAVHDGTSPGTAHVIECAKKQKKETIVINYKR